MNLMLVTDFGTHAVPTAVADYFRDLRFTKAGAPDRRFGKGRMLNDYFSRQARLAREAFVGGSEFAPEPEITADMVIGTSILAVVYRPLQTGLVA